MGRDVDGCARRVTRVDSWGVLATHCFCGDVGDGMQDGEAPCGVLAAPTAHRRLQGGLAGMGASFGASGCLMM